MLYLWLYAIGVGLGLAVMRDPWPSRLATALVWPLGPMAFVVVATLLVAVAALLWPLVMLGAAAVAAVLIWLL